MRMLVWSIAMAFSLLALSGCATNTPVEIKDLTVYGSLGQSGVAVVHTLSTQTSTMGLADWEDVWMNPAQTPMLCLSANDFAEAKKEEELLCSYLGSCSPDVQSAVNAFYLRIQTHLERARVQPFSTF